MMLSRKQIDDPLAVLLAPELLVETLRKLVEWVEDVHGDCLGCTPRCPDWEHEACAGRPLTKWLKGEEKCHV